MRLTVRVQFALYSVKESIVLMTIWSPTLQSGKPIYIAIADAIDQDIRSGNLKPGQKLPPHRDLAWRLKVTTGTVTRAYKEAEIRGLLSGEVGRGSFIRQTSSPAPFAARGEAASPILDLSQATPPPVYGASDFDDALNFVLRDPARLDLLDYVTPEGEARYRRMAANWLARSGIEVEPDQTIVTPGAFHGLSVVLEALVQPGEGVMAEALNYPMLRPLLKRLNLVPKPIEMTAGGIDLVSLERVAKSGEARLLYIVPTYQNPTTTTLNRERREALVSLARRYNLTIIEDDLLRLLDARLQPPTLYSLAPERTFHITSLSKTLAPGLRLGFVAAAEGKSRLLHAQARASGTRVTAMTAEVARYWTGTDVADRIMSRVHQELQARRAVFIDVFAGFDFMCEPGAPNGWLNLPPQWTGSRLASAALAQNLRISPAASFMFGNRSPDKAVRVSFGRPQTTAELRSALMSLRALMQDQPADEFMPVA